MNTTQTGAHPSFWRDRIAVPIRQVFAQGTSPDKIAQCFGFGFLFSVLPFPGFSSILCALVAVWMKLNMAAIQAINWLCIGLQIALVVPFIRMGAWMWHATPPLAGPELIAQLKASPIAFARMFGWSVIHALTAWVIIGPIVAWSTYGIVRAVATRVARANPTV